MIPGSRHQPFTRLVTSMRSAVLAVTLFCTTGCSLFVSPDSVTVVSYPLRRNQVLAVGEPVRLRFDRSMDEQSVEQIVQIQSPAGTVAGRFEWDNTEMRFLPDPPLAPGVRYVLVFSGIVYDRRGRQHTVSVTVPFFVLSQNHLPPAVTSVEPAPGSIIGPDTPVTISFTGSMCRSSIEDRLSVAPATRFEYEWNPHNDQVTLAPADLWSFPGTITITLPSDVTDEDGAALLREEQFTFHAQSDLDRPAVVSIESIVSDRYSPTPFLGPGDDLMATDYVFASGSAIRITFSHPMDAGATERAFTLHPATAGKFHWPAPEVMVFAPGSGFAVEHDHRLTVTDRASDLDGNRLIEAVTLEFRVSDSVLTLDRLSVSSTSETAITVFDDSVATRLTAGDPPHYPATMVFAFSHRLPTDSEKLRLFASLSISTLLPGVFSSPFPVGYSWLDDRTVSITYHGLTPSTAQSRHYLLLKISGGVAGLRTDAGNELEADIRQLFVVEES